MAESSAWHSPQDLVSARQDARNCTAATGHTLRITSSILSDFALQDLCLAGPANCLYHSGTASQTRVIVAKQKLLKSFLEVGRGIEVQC